MYEKNYSPINLQIKCSWVRDVSKQSIDLISKVCYIIYIIEP